MCDRHPLRPVIFYVHLSTPLLLRWVFPYLRTCMKSNIWWYEIDTQVGIRVVFGVDTINLCCLHAYTGCDKCCTKYRGVAGECQQQVATCLTVNIGYSDGYMLSVNKGCSLFRPHSCMWRPICGDVKRVKTETRFVQVHKCRCFRIHKIHFKINEWIGTFCPKAKAI